MTVREARLYAASINSLARPGLGRAWVNTGQGEDDSTISVRNTLGIESELHVAPQSSTDLYTFMNEAGDRTVPPDPDWGCLVL